MRTTSQRSGRALARQPPARQPPRDLPKVRRCRAELQSLFLHFLSQAEWTHVCPNFLDVSQALFFCAALACILPAQRIFPMGRPDRVLLFMVKHNFVNCLIFLFVSHYGFSCGFAMRGFALLFAPCKSSCRAIQSRHCRPPCIGMFKTTILCALREKWMPELRIS